MAQPKLLYFNVRAKGELIRLVAAAGGVKIEDQRIPFADWPTQWKPKTPFGQIPCLVVGDQWYAQKMAIVYYLANKGSLIPTGNDLDKLKADMYVLFTEEILDNILEGFRHKKFNNNPDTLEKVKNETLPQKLPRLEAGLKGSKSGFFVGDKLTLADLGAFDILEHVVDILGKSALDAYPLLKAHFEKIGSIPAIKNHVASRGKQEEGFELF